MGCLLFGGGVGAMSALDAREHHSNSLPSLLRLPLLLSKRLGLGKSVQTLSKRLCLSCARAPSTPSPLFSSLLSYPLLSHPLSVSPVNLPVARRSRCCPAFVTMLNPSSSAEAAEAAAASELPWPPRQRRRRDRARAPMAAQQEECSAVSIERRPMTINNGSPTRR